MSSRSQAKTKHADGEKFDKPSRGIRRPPHTILEDFAGANLCILTHNRCQEQKKQVNERSGAGNELG